MKNNLEEFIQTLLTVAYGFIVAILVMCFLIGYYHPIPKHETNTKIVDTIYIHDTVFIQCQ